jgi:hypothetical protein
LRAVATDAGIADGIVQSFDVRPKQNVVDVPKRELAVKRRRVAVAGLR